MYKYKEGDPEAFSIHIAAGVRRRRTEGRTLSAPESADELNIVYV